MEYFYHEEREGLKHFTPFEQSSVDLLKERLLCYKLKADQDQDILFRSLQPFFRARNIGAP